MKRLAAFFAYILMLVIPLTSFGQEFENGDLKYRVVSQDDLTVEVAGLAEGKSDTVVTIPIDVTNDTKTYTVVAIANNAFKGNTTLATVTIGKDSQLATIGNSAFEGVKSLKVIGYEEDKTTYFPGSITSIGEKAFKGSWIRIINLSKCIGLTSVGTEAFASIGGLSFITATFPASLKEIAPNTFLGNTRLVSVDAPGVKVVGENAFKGCSRLQTAKLPALTTLGASAFENTKLSEFTVVSTVTSIEAKAFAGVTSFETITS